MGTYARMLRCSGTIVGVSATDVVGLRIWCDLDRVDGITDLSAVSCFLVHEFARLSDGREVVLLDDRGWTGAPVSLLSSRDIEAHAYSVLLPDWADVNNPLPQELAIAEAVGGAQDWNLLSQRLRYHGAIATPDQLARMPRQFQLSERLAADVKDAP